ncbi:MAG: Lacal_2735 family protein [Gelidibacter sp.]
MNQHFCKVGKIRFGLSEVINLKEIEKNYLKFSEEAYNLMQTDSSLSDFLYEEANKLKKLILSLKSANTNDVDAAF